MTITPTMLTFFSVMVLAITLENAVFSRALSTEKVLFETTSKRDLLIFGVAITAMTTGAAALVYPFNLFMRSVEFNVYRRSVFFLLCIFAVYEVLSFLIRTIAPSFYERIRLIFSASAMNSAVFGSILFAVMKGYDLRSFLAYGLGTGIGLTGAVLLVAYGREALELSEAPKAFKGLPLLFVYLGILSLSLYGLIGHQLPS